MIAVYAITLDLDGSEALAQADAQIDKLAATLDPQSAKVERGTSTARKNPARKAGLLHGSEPRLSAQESRYSQSRRDLILTELHDLVICLLHEDRKEDGDLPRGAVEEEVEADPAFYHEMVGQFAKQLLDRLKK